MSAGDVFDETALLPEEPRAASVEGASAKGVIR
jgi:hypothetical protein